MGFYIKQISVNYEDSNDVVDFENGLNIIVGPSNTGKSMVLKCIDFLFGSKIKPFDKSVNCKAVSMLLVSDSREIHLSRKIDEDAVTVNSQNDDIESATYYCGNSKKNPQLSEVYLKLIGITEGASIYTNKKFKTHLLTWRFILHMFFLNENRIISEDSPLLTGQFTDITKCLSAIKFLINGESAEQNEKESKKVKEAIKNYINEQISLLSSKKQEIQTELTELNHIDYLSEIEKVSDTIKSIEESIVSGINANKKALEKIKELNEIQAENRCLFHNYENLRTQYESDLKRLSFIIDGNLNHKPQKQSGCPFCNTPISLPKRENYIEAAIAEARKIKKQIDDLKSAQDNLKEEIDIVSKEINQYEEKNRVILRINEEEYKPQIIELKEKIEEYKTLWRKENEISFITESCKHQEKYLEEKINVVEPVEEYNPKTELNKLFVPEFTEKIKANLEMAGYDNLNTISVDENAMDLVVNGSEKRTNGKGYKAFFNSITTLSFVEFLLSFAEYKPNLVFLDSPILSLKEKEDTKIKDSLKSGLFRLFVGKSNEMQIIVVENEIPSIDYRNANIVKFTRDKDVGRYGFLKCLSN